MKNRFEEEKIYEQEAISVSDSLKEIAEGEYSFSEKVLMLDKLIMDYAMGEKKAIAQEDFPDIDKFSLEAVSRRADKLESVMSDGDSEIGKAIKMRNDLMRQIEKSGPEGAEAIDKIVKEEEVRRLAMLRDDLEESLEEYRRIKGVDSDEAVQELESSLQALKDQEVILRGEE